MLCTIRSCCLLKKDLSGTAGIEHCQILKNCLVHSRYKRWRCLLQDPLLLMQCLQRSQGRLQHWLKNACQWNSRDMLKNQVQSIALRDILCKSLHLPRPSGCDICLPSKGCRIGTLGRTKSQSHTFYTL